MTGSLPSRPTSRQARAVFFALLAIEAAAAWVSLVLIPPDPKNSVLFGYSLNRLALMAAAGGAAFVSGFLAVSTIRGKTTFPARVAVSRYSVYLKALLLAFSMGVWLVLVLLQADAVGSLASYSVRLRPLLVLAWLFSWQSVLWLWVERHGFPKFTLEAAKPWAWPAAISAAALLILVTVMAWTGLGITPDLYAWSSAGIPLLAWQVAGVGLLGLLLYGRLPGMFGRVPGKVAWVDLVLSLLLWAITAALWLNQPVTPSYYAPQRPPNDAFYPYSDASYYDLSAQQLLIGNGYNNHQVVTRPLYILFLGLSHALVGQEYSRVVAVQSLLLALFPVCLYWLGRQAHTRAAGVVLAILFAIRELNAFAATPLTEVSHSKLLLTDFPTALGVAAFALLAVIWLRFPGRRWLPLAAGGGLGFLVLLRAQAVIFLPFIIALALLAYRRRWRLWLEAALVFCLGFGLVISPWIARNYVVTGKVVFDQATNQSVIFGQRYSMTDNDLPAMLPEESPDQFSARMMSSAREFALQHPGYTLRFIAAHWLNNEAATLAVLPFKFSLDDYQDTLVLKSVFWVELFGRLSMSEGIALVFYLALIAVGMGAAWYRLGPAGLVPLVLNIAYSLSNAVARNSGWRYILPVDWAAVFYVFVGGLALAGVLFNREGIPHPNVEVQKSVFPWRTVAFLALGLLLAGAVVPLAEYAFPRRFSVETREQLAGALASLPDSPATVAADENQIVLRGLALYPRFYRAGQGEMGSGWPVFAVRDEERLAFILVSEDGNRQVLLPLDGEPAVFPNAAEVLIMGCKRVDQKYVQADLVVMVDPPGQVYRSTKSFSPCP